MRSLRDYYDEGAPLEKVTEFLDKLKDLPTGYFEAKIPRAVQLEEFSAAIIPSDLDPKLKKVLEERGLELREYDVEQAYPFDQSRRKTLQKQTEEADLRFMPAPTFYSKAERAVEASQQKTMSVDQAVSLATKGIPKAEYEWSGVVDWLEGRKEEGEGKVSKAELMEFLQNKGVKVEEVYRSGYDTDMLREKYADQMAKRFEVVKEKDPDDPLAHDYVIYDENGEIYRGEGGGIISFKSPLDAEANLRDRLFDEAMRMPDQELREYVEGGNLSGSKGPTLFQPGESDWVMLPGDEKAQQSYGELVLTLPDSNANQRNTLAAEVDRRKSRIRGIGDEIKKLEIKLPTEHELKEGLLPSVESWLNTEVRPKLKVLHADLDLEVQKLEPFTKRLATLGPYRETFELPSSHRFPESNILAHIRFTERVDADGKKMLFIEELQSDWSNTGRSDGWKQERPAEVQKEIQRLKKERKQFHDEESDRFSPKWWGGKLREYNPEELERLGSLIKELEERYPSNPSGAPDMPFKGDNRYGALAMKRMIRWASDNGFDRLGWITGKDTAERYNLSKHVDEVKYFPETESLIASKGKWGTDSYQRLVDKRDITPDQLEAHLGKDIAKKLLDSPLQEGPRYARSSGAHILAGDDLAIGGEWATTLYDKVLPTQAKKIVKKKGAVGRTRLGSETAKNIHNAGSILLKERALKNEKKEVARLEREINDLVEAGVKISKKSNLGSALSDMKKMVRETEGELQELRDKQNNQETSEANYVDITPEVKALAEEGFSYFMPPGGGKGRAAAPAQPAPTLPATPIMPKVKLTDEEKEDSRRLLNLLKEKGI